MHSDFCRLPATRNTNITMYNIVILLYAEPIWLKWNKFAADVHNCQLNRNDTTARGVSQYIPIHVPYISILYIHNSWYMKILGMRCNALTEHFYIWQDSRHLIYVARDWWSENICVQNWSIYQQYISISRSAGDAQWCYQTSSRSNHLETQNMLIMTLSRSR